jgi:hypothetical protein
VIPEELPEGEEFRDDEYPDARETGDTFPCPHCRRPIFVDAERCPECGAYVTTDAPARRGMPGWFWIGVAAALFVLLWWILRS